MTNILIQTPQDMHDFGVALGKVLQAGDLVLLTGHLGAGKTTLTRGIGEGMGVRGTITSPTFVLARTHPPLQAGPGLVHVDAYRLTDSAEFEDLDIDMRRNAVVAEWGAGLVNEDEIALEIVINRPTGAAYANLPGGSVTQSDREQQTYNPEEEPTEPREITINARGKRWQNIDFAQLINSDK